jgi:hypothetical protein
MIQDDEIPRDYVYNNICRGAVLKNIYGCVKRELNYLLLSRTDAFEYNTLILRVISGLQSVLDMTARLCDDLLPSVINKDDDRIYFNKYDFCQSEWQGVRNLQQKLLAQRFNNRTMFDISEKLREMPWMGRISTDEKLSITDIFSNVRKYEGPSIEYSYSPTDDISSEHICFIHGFIHRIDTLTQSIVSILFKFTNEQKSEFQNL